MSNFFFLNDWLDLGLCLSNLIKLPFVVLTLYHLLYYVEVFPSLIMDASLIFLYIVVFFGALWAMAFSG